MHSVFAPGVDPMFTAMPAATPAQIAAERARDLARIALWIAEKKV